MVDAVDGYSTTGKKAHLMCGHYNGSPHTGSNPVLTANNKYYEDDTCFFKLHSIFDKW